MTRELEWREVDVPALNQALSSRQTYYVQDSAMLEIKPLEVKDYESQYRAEYWRQLSLPQDGMWEVFARMAGYSELIWAGKPCGFVSVNKENQLLHFFVMPQYQNQVAEVWQRFLEETSINTAQVGSHDPQFFSLCLDQNNTVQVHMLLYHNPKGNRGQKIALRDGETFEKASPDTLDELLSFSQFHTGDSGSWLKDYLSHWVMQEAVYCLRDEGQLVATGELRPSASQLGVADIGVIVHGEYRGKGTATRVVKALIYEGWIQKWTLIASTEHQNLGAQKALSRAGLVTHHRMAEVSW